LKRLGLLDWIGSAIEYAISEVHPDYRLMAAIVMILWVSAFASSLIDNIPFTAMMIGIVQRLGTSEVVQLPLEPLVWALSFGACLGGKITDIQCITLPCADVLTVPHNLLFLDSPKSYIPFFLEKVCFSLLCQNADFIFKIPFSAIPLEHASERCRKVVQELGFVQQ
jgi:hypothetical protein